MTNDEMLEVLRVKVQSDEPEFLKKRITEMAVIIEQLVRERDAAVKDLKEMERYAYCPVCKHHKLHYTDEPCKSCRSGLGFEDNWEWRGVQDEQAN